MTREERDGYEGWIKGIMANEEAWLVEMGKHDN